MNLNKFFAVGMDREFGNFKPIDIVWHNTVLNFGAGNKKIEESVSLDYPDWDADSQNIPWPDGSVDDIVAMHFFEHLSNPVYVLQECQRVLKVGGTLNILVPYYNSQMQAQDLDHKSQFCEETWKILFRNPYYDKNKIDWKFKINFNMIMGISERNLALVTQLEKI